MSEVVDLLRALIGCASVTPADAGCQEIIEARLSAVGFRVEVLAFGGVRNLWATHGEGSPHVCFAGHTDVVPPGPRDAWNSDPFVATEVDGHLVGRGAADMKGSVAAMVVALERLAKKGHLGTLSLLLTSDEEGPAVDGTRRVLDELTARGVKIDAAIVGEPTCERRFGDTFKIGRRGSLQGRAHVRGKLGHTAYPQLADNAAHRAASVLNRLLGIDWGVGTAEFPPTTFQVSNLQCGTGALNVIPDSATIFFNIRFGTDWSADGILHTLEAAVGDEATIAIDPPSLPFLTNEPKLVEAVSQAVSERTGILPSPSTGGGTSDARFFAAHGIPVIEFGPLNATIHAANERVSTQDVTLLADVYVGLVTRLSAV